MHKAGIGQWFVYGVCRGALGLLRILPFPVARGMAFTGGLLAYRLLGHHRAIARVNTGIVFPGMGRRERDRIAARSFAHLGELLIWIARLPGLLDPRKLRRVVRYEGFEHYARVRAEGRATLFLTAHLGPWELLSFSHGVYTGPVHFIMRPLDYELFDRFITRRRTLSGCIPILKKDALRKIVRALSHGEDVGILLDQKVQEGEGVFVDFFGHPASMARGPAGIARSTGAAVLPAFITPDPERKARFSFRIEPEIPLQKTTDREADDRENTQRFARAIEEAVRRDPEWWLWGHRRWRTRPPGTPDPYEGI